MSIVRPLKQLVILVLLALFLFGVAVFIFQRRLLYSPTHQTGTNGLAVWRIAGQAVGCVRMAPHPKNIWLFIHGNAGQAADRSYALPCFSPSDAVFILEYPGYGTRPGSPGKASFDAAAAQAYLWLRKSYPGVPVCVLGESIGSGPAATLAQQSLPPDKMVLVVPFDTLASVAQEHFPLLPVRLMLRDRWDNHAALHNYAGKLEIYGAIDDQIIPVRHAERLAQAVPRAIFYAIPGGHNDWSQCGAVRIHN